MAKRLMLVLIAALVASPVLAQEEDDAAYAAVSADKAKRRAYPGGRDEQELEVQATLTIPSRSPEGQAQATAPDIESQSHD